MSESPPHDGQMKDFQDKLGKILDRVTRIETILEIQNDYDKRLRALELAQAAEREHPTADHEKRIKDLETKAAEQKGRSSIFNFIAGMGASIVVAVVGALLVSYLRGH